MGDRSIRCGRGADLRMWSERLRMPVKTRSMTHSMTHSITNFCVSIDFDAASKAWRQNKTVLGNGCFAYKNETPYNLRSKHKQQYT